VPIEGAASIRHTYAQAGDYALTVDLQLWGLPPRSDAQRIHVRPR
jgi:hypothetical protein